MNNAINPIIFFYCMVLSIFYGCEQKEGSDDNKNVWQVEHERKNESDGTPKKVPDGMVWISGGEFIQGAVPHDKMAMAHEKPPHQVYVDGFFMDIHEVTNAQFAKFVDETGYVTVAEREIDTGKR